MRNASSKILLVVLFLMAVGACKKSSDNSTPTTTGSVVGFWGGAGVANGATQIVSIVFKSDGKMRFYGGVSKATDTASLAASSKSDGTYTVSGTTITTNYVLSGAALLLVATANSSFTTMSGTAGIAPTSTGLGTFTFTKQ